jgi:soluble lytic murein transglycosylase-like protein
MYHKRLSLILAMLLGIVSVPSIAKLTTRLSSDGTLHVTDTKGGIFCKKDLPYKNMVKRYAKRYHIDPCLVLCIIEVESNFKAGAVSQSGAMGLMQLMQDTARLYKVKDPLDPEENIRGGSAHLAYLFRVFGKKTPLVLAAYHAGVGRVKKRMAVPPVKSTVAYVNRVMTLYRGKGNYVRYVKRLYQRIDKNGDIIIRDR